MHTFTFNDCIPNQASDDQVFKCFRNSLIEYRKIKAEHTGLINGILTHMDPEKLFVNERLNLKQMVLMLDIDMRKFAFSNFNKYPLEDYYPDLNIEEILSQNYRTIADGLELDALNIKICQLFDGILFTLALCEDIKRNSITIIEEDQNLTYIDNQYGAEENTEYIIEAIREKQIASKSGFEKFCILLGDTVYLKSFKEDFEKLPLECQDSVNLEVQKAINRNLQTSLAPDNDVVKDVTPAKENAIKICELRIFEPVALRVYFSEKNSKIYLGSIKKKPAKKVQTNDIKTAINIIKALEKVGK
jgi:putative component of toxin-antitoxin plasmid stabilization module